MEEVIKDVVVKNALGLHARPAAKLSQEAMKFQAEIKLCYKEVEVNAKSILDILTLAVPMGEVLTLRAKGDDAIQAIKQLEWLFENRFGEEK
ncbi:phosphocarrier protein [Desulfonauticus submarinus]|uniref:Phosphocarrier protein HPr n=1 Tax=Desulfonauticus submarinus TaxID=206665 RepID=A0A1H0DX21_9BACT|nr:HPr family phosphocarrier protein [Desulfonauticus submarinus]SDN74700.1 phosphocarrier protein [Desulfonauticus submarinus]